MKQLLESLNKEIKFAHRLATVQNFTQLLSEGSTLMHFSGHGYDSKYKKSEEGYLAFENAEVNKLFCDRGHFYITSFQAKRGRRPGWLSSGIGLAEMKQNF